RSSSSRPVVVTSRLSSVPGAKVRGCHTSRTSGLLREPGPMYDYVIVGAGSAGCALAARLSADAATRVLVLEAGGADSRREIGIPAAMAKLFRTEVDWDYSTEPEEQLAGRRIYMPRGKVLGGSSSINSMVYVRGHRTDFDAWGPG